MGARGPDSAYLLTSARGSIPPHPDTSLTAPRWNPKPELWAPVEQPGVIAWPQCHEWRVGASDHGKYHRLVQTIQKLGPWRPPKRVVNRATRQHTHEAESVHPQRTNSLSKIQSRVTPRHRIRREVSIHASPKTLPGMKTLASKVLSSMALFTAFHSQGHTYPAYKQAQRKQKNRTFWSSGCARATAKIVRKHQKPHGTPMACTTASAMSSPRVLSSINSGIGRFVLGESGSTTSKLDQKTLQLQSASQAPPSFLS